MVNMAKYAGLPWDVMLGAEVAHAYNPQPEAYDRTAALARSEARAVHDGGGAQRRSGRGARPRLRTAFVSRPLEHGPNKTRDVRAEHDFDVIAGDFIDLAAKLGC